MLVEQGVAEAAVGVGAHRGDHAVGVEVRGEDVGAEAGELGVAAHPRRRQHPQGRAAELDRLPAAAREDGPGGGARPPPAGAAAGRSASRRSSPDGCAGRARRSRAAGACRGPRRPRACGRRAVRSRPPARAGSAPLRRTSSPTSVASKRRAARRIVSPSATPPSCRSADARVEWAMFGEPQRDPTGPQAGAGDRRRPGRRSGVGILLRHPAGAAALGFGDDRRLRRGAGEGRRRPRPRPRGADPRRPRRPRALRDALILAAAALDAADAVSPRRRRPRTRDPRGRRRRRRLRRRRGRRLPLGLGAACGPSLEALRRRAVAAGCGVGLEVVRLDHAVDQAVLDRVLRAGRICRVPCRGGSAPPTGRCA